MKVSKYRPLFSNMEYKPFLFLTFIFVSTKETIVLLFCSSYIIDNFALRESAQIFKIKYEEKY